MAEPFRSIQSQQILTGKGIIEILSLISSASEPSTVSIYDSEEGQGLLGRRLWDLASPTSDSKITPKLNIPYKNGIFCSLSGAGSAAIVTIK